MAKSARNVGVRRRTDTTAAPAGAINTRPASHGTPFEILQAIVGHTHTATNLDELFARALGTLHDQAGITTGAVLQLDPSDTALHRRSLHSADPAGWLPHSLAEAGAASTVLRTGGALVIDAQHASARASGGPETQIYAPIVVRGEPWGLLVLATAQPGFSAPQLSQLAEGAAQLLALAIELALLGEYAQLYAQLPPDSQRRLPVPTIAQAQQRQAEVITSSKLTAVGTLAAGIAHEFNNLLAGIQGYAELGMTGTSAEKDESLKIVRQICRRGVQLTRRLLTFARQNESTREFAAIDELAESALQLIEWDLVRANLSVQRSYRSSAEVLVEPGQIMQVVLHLLSNARDATAPGGTVTISTAERDEWIELAVADTGTGIAEHIRSRIFEPFVTTKGAFGGSAIAGTGLGLSVSYGIVQAHQGHLQIESTIGLGSRFTILLPRPRWPAQHLPGNSHSV